MHSNDGVCLMLTQYNLLLLINNCDSLNCLAESSLHNFDLKLNNKKQK